MNERTLGFLHTPRNLRSGVIQRALIPLRYSWFVIACMVSSGCFPYHYTSRPGISGIVVSGDGQKPVPDAIVSFGRTNVAAVAVSSANGSFAVPPKRTWGIWIIPQDVFASHWLVCIRHDGYATNYTEFAFSAAATGKAARKDLGVIPLKPLAE